MGMDIFIYEPFNLKSINTELGCSENNTHGLKSLEKQFQEMFIQGFKLYFEAPLLFFTENSSKQWHEMRKQLKNSSELSINTLKEKIKKIKTHHHDLIKLKEWQSRCSFNTLLLDDKFWQKTLSLSFGNAKAAMLIIKNDIKNIGQFLEFNPPALLYVANKIFPKLLKLTNNSLEELQQKKSKIPKKIHKKYSQYLINLKNRLILQNGVQCSEKEKIAACAFALLQRYAANEHLDINYYFLQQFNKEKIILKKNLKFKPIDYQLTNSEFSQLHRIVIQFGGLDWYQRLQELSWWKTADESYNSNFVFDLTLVISKENYFAIPTLLKSFVPNKIRKPKFIFFGTFIRHKFFKNQFLNLVKFKKHASSLDKLQLTLQQSKNIKFSDLALFSEHILDIEQLISIFYKNIYSIKINWFLLLFSAKTVLFFTKWKEILKQQQQLLISYKKVFAKLMIEKTDQNIKENLINSDDNLTFLEKDKIENFYIQQISKEDYAYIEKSKKSFDDFLQKKDIDKKIQEEIPFVKILKNSSVKADEEKNLILKQITVQEKKENFSIAIIDRNYIALYQMLNQLIYENSDLAKFCFQELKKQIKINIKNITFYENNQIHDQCLIKVSNQAADCFDLYLLKQLCLSQDLAYISWYDEKARLKFHQNMFNLWKDIKNQKYFDFFKIKKMANYLRLWEFESIDHNNGAGKKYVEWHRELEKQSEQFFSQILTANIEMFQNDTIQKLTFFLAYFKFYSSPKIELKNKFYCVYLYAYLGILLNWRKKDENIFPEEICELSNFYIYLINHDNKEEFLSNTVENYKEKCIFVLKNFLYSLVDILMKKNTKNVLLDKCVSAYAHVEKILEELLIQELPWQDLQKRIIDLVNEIQSLNDTSKSFLQCHAL